MMKKIFSTATWKQSQITVIGTIINGVLGAFFYILMARFLGPFNFGLFTVSVAALTLIADIADLGTNTGLVRFVSLHLNKDHEKVYKFLKLGLEIKFLVWIVILIIGFFSSPIIAESIFGKSELIIPLRLVMVGVGGALLFTYATSSLQSLQKFVSWSLINIFSNFLRLLLIFILFSIGQLNLYNGLASYIVLPFLGFSLSLLFLPIRKILAAKNEKSLAGQFFKFNRWVALFTIISAVSSRLDTFLNTRLLTVTDIGIYGAANQLTQVIPQIVGALGVVAAPKFASFQARTEMFAYFKKFQLLVLALSFVIILVIPLSFFIIPFLFGPDYSQSVMPFIILLLAMLVFLISVPLHNSIIYYFGRADVFVWISIINLLLVSILGYFLITSFGVIGTSITVLIGMLANFFIPLLWFIKKLRS